MKKNILKLPILITILLVVGCSTDNNVQALQEFEQISSKSVIEKLAIETSGFVYAGEDLELSEVFKNLNNTELDLYLNLMAELMAEDGLHLENDKVYKSKKYYYLLLKGLQDYGLEYYGKNYNHMTNKEIGNIDDLYGAEIFKRAKQELPEDVLKEMENLLYGEKSERNQKGLCPTFKYTLNTYISNYFSINCLSYAIISGEGQWDCDYEFIFNWNNSYSINSLGLYGTSSGVRRVLGMGGIDGRYNTAGNKVSFLIGAGRVVMYVGLPTSFKQKLKGNWH